MTKLWLVRWYPPNPLDDEALIGQNSATILLGLNISTLKNKVTFKPSNTLYADTVKCVVESSKRKFFCSFLWWKKTRIFVYQYEETLFNMLQEFTLFIHAFDAAFSGDTHSDKYLTGFQHFPDLNWYLWWVKIYTQMVNSSLSGTTSKYILAFLLLFL